MQHNDFEVLVKHLSTLADLPAALEALKQVEDEEVAAAAAALTGQFALAEVEGEQRIYHVTLQDNDEGVEEEFVEHVMNAGDETLVFVAWFFDSQFEVKAKDTYQAAGKTYRQPKRS
ncbi:hypothetical protein [Vibrio sp.]|uniref:hypothetical protein n=1 Tax=Vibrio sp. TaxID=678 RepID=UPI002871622F|nr:hypothetical protein [Vibrio sp. FNV 38]